MDIPPPLAIAHRVVNDEPISPEESQSVARETEGCFERWGFTETDGLDAEIDLSSLDAALPFSEIDRDVSFDSDENGD